MRVILMVLVLFFTGCSKVIIKDSVNIYNVNGVKDVLFDKTIQWIAKDFNSAKDFIQLQDKSNGIIIGSGNTKISDFWASYLFMFKMTIEIKDNRIRISYSDIDIEYWNSSIHAYQNQNGRFTQNEIENKLNGITELLLTFLKTDNTW